MFSTKVQYTGIDIVFCVPDFLEKLNFDKDPGCGRAILFKIVIKVNLLLIIV